MRDLTPEEIANILNTQLNIGTETAWVEVSGTLGLPQTDLSNPDSINVKFDQTVVVKAFLNTHTKEIKLYPLKAIIGD